LSREAFLQALEGSNEVEIGFQGRRSGKTYRTPVWYVLEGRTILLLPVSGSKTSWYRNILEKPRLSLRAGGREITVPVKPLTEKGAVKAVVEKFRAKYGAGEIKRYYTGLDVAVEATLPD